MPHDAIASQAKCSQRQVRRILYNLVHYDLIKRPKAALQGRKWSLTVEMKQVPFLLLQSGMLILGTSRVSQLSMHWIY